MGFEKSYLKTPPGLLRVFVIVVGVVALAVGAYGHYGSVYIWKTKEEAFIWTHAAVLFVSLILLVINISSNSISNSKSFRFLDAAFHVLGAIALIIVGALMIDGAVEIDQTVCWCPFQQCFWPFPEPCQRYGEKLAAGIISIINGLLFGVCAGLILSRKQPTPKENFGEHKNGTQDVQFVAANSDPLYTTESKESVTTTQRITCNYSNVGEGSQVANDKKQMHTTSVEIMVK